jgi:hypothetical protein
VSSFHAVFKLYCPSTGTFFMPVGELGLAMHEMWEISRLPMGAYPYEEYVPCNEEIKELSAKHGVMYDTYRELMCHFHICLNMNRTRGHNNGLKQWAEHLFVNLDNNSSEVRIRVADDVSIIAKRLENSQFTDFILEEDQGGHFKGEVFRSYHHQARVVLSRRAVLAGFLSLWLKRCVVPSLPRDCISPMVIIPVVLLVFGCRLGLLPAMICSIQRGL